MRWNLGLPKALKPHGKFRALLYPLILIETILTPFLMPIIGYAFHKDQNKVHVYFNLSSHGRQPLTILNKLKYLFVLLICQRRQRSNAKIQDQTSTILTAEKKPRLDILGIKTD